MWRSYKDKIGIDDLLQRTLTKVYRRKGDNEELVFETEDATYVMTHQQDCCELVRIEDINGDLEDLIGSSITLAEETTNSGYGKGEGHPGENDEYVESWTWTFYRLATVKGYVTIRWLGESNGYYSESVDFYKYPKNTEEGNNE